MSYNKFMRNLMIWICFLFFVHVFALSLLVDCIYHGQANVIGKFGWSRD